MSLPEQNGKEKVRIIIKYSFEIQISAFFFQRKTSPFRRVREEDADPEYLKKIGKNAFDHKVKISFCKFNLYFIYFHRLVHVVHGVRKRVLI